MTAKKTRAKRGPKIPKSRRSHRPCPHCGRTQPGPEERAASGKPSGLKHRRAHRSEAPTTPDATQAVEPPRSPTPIDAVTLIKGVVARVPEALEGAGLGEVPATTALNAAVRKAVLDEFRTRAQFAGRIAEIDALLWSQAAHAGDTVEGAMTAHLRELRLLRVTEPEESDRFVVTEGEGEFYELLRPAYVDELTGKVILAGQLRRVPEHAGRTAGEEA
ncbi:hypothetical protein AB0D04_07105 [Streptomyces sp. NPDC048483]|uniref:hypothetical protein n=1 Tax=Streptomyces sp. NPDC048483 TaxID=3154927 RepID=UPI00343536F9